MLLPDAVLYDVAPLLQRLGAVLAVSSVVLGENKAVAAIVQQPVKHLALSPILQVAA
jgi:hypothetical protein